MTEPILKTEAKSDDDHIVYDLTNSSHTSNLFPKKVWKTHYQNALDELDKAEQLSTLQPFQGEYKLRKEISRYLERIRGVKCHPDQIIITSGLQQSLDYICQFLGNTKRSVLMEDPSYPKAREIFKKNAYPIVTAEDYLGRVIYLGTFSKILSPAFRMGYMVLPEQFTESFLEKFKLYNSTVNLLNQIALANILSSGDYDRLVRKMNHVFKKRYEAFKKEFEQFNAPIKLSSNVSGQYFLLTFPDKINQCDVIKRAETEGVRVYDTMHFWQEKAACPQESLFLGFSKIDLEDIPDCVRHLRKAWEN